MGKVTGDISNFRFPNACKIELRAFREAGTFIRVDGEMRQLLAYFDNPVGISSNVANSFSEYSLLCGHYFYLGFDVTNKLR